ncbi:19842_t:CDS:2, partial [Gigaspora margarita]
EKNEYKVQITRLSDQNQQYQQEITRLEFMRNWSGITIADQNLQIRRLQDQVERFSLGEINRLRNENQLLSQVVSGRMIRGAINELRDDNQRLDQENQRLNQDIQRLNQDLEIVRRVRDNRIATQNVQIRNLQERVEQHSAELRERGIRTIPMFTRQEAFLEDDDMDTN